MITSYETQTVGGGMLQAIVNQEVGREMARQRAALAAEAEAREAEHRREVAALQERLRFSERRGGQLRAELIDKTEYKYAPVEMRRYTLIDRLWGLYGLLILAAGALADGAKAAGGKAWEAAEKREKAKRNRKKRVRKNRKLAKDARRWT